MPWANLFSRIRKMTLMEKYETTEVVVDHHGSSLLVVSLLETLCLLGIRILGLWTCCLGHGSIWACISDGWFRLGVARCKGPCSSPSRGGTISAANFTVCLLFPQSALLEFASLTCQYLAICSNKFSLLRWACLTFWSCTLNSCTCVRPFDSFVLWHMRWCHVGSQLGEQVTVWLEGMRSWHAAGDAAG